MITWAEPELSSQASHSLRLPDNNYTQNFASALRASTFGPAGLSLAFAFCLGATRVGTPLYSSGERLLNYGSALWASLLHYAVGPCKPRLSSVHILTTPALCPGIHGLAFQTYIVYTPEYCVIAQTTLKNRRLQRRDCSRPRFFTRSSATATPRTSPRRL